jgi:hypothetical protein
MFIEVPEDYYNEMLLIFVSRQMTWLVLALMYSKNILYLEMGAKAP